MQFLYMSQHCAKALVLGDGGVGHALIHVEDFVGQGLSFPTHFEPAIHECIGIHVFANQPA